MRILCIGASKNDEVLRISRTLRNLGHKVEMVYSDTYSSKCSYWEKKIYRLGIGTIYRKYMLNWKQNFQQKLEQLNPEMILFVDFWDEFFSPEEIKLLSQNYHLVLWLVDNVARFEHTLDPYFPFFSKVWCFEETDVYDLKKQYQIDAEYLPVGYNDAYQHIVHEKNDKIYDLGFVGVPHHKRLRILEYLLAQTGATAKICGPFYSTRYFWKKIQFKKRYPYIFKYLDNRFYYPEEVASVYAQSRICLNINQKNHHGINPRTYDIMATGAFELLEEREEYGPILRTGENIITFTNKEDLLKKVKYYLSHDKEREMIAKRGWSAVYDHMSMVNTLKTIVEEAGGTHGRTNFRND